MKQAVAASLPNILTLLRIALTPIVVYCLAQKTPGLLLLSFILFNIAVLTDWLDGLVARHFDAEGELGNFLDPLADKVLVWGMLGYAMMTNIFPLSLYLIIVGRDLAITGLRMYLQHKQTPLQTSKYGKLKTAMQFILAYLCYGIWYIHIVPLGLSIATQNILIMGMNILIGITLCVTVLSGIQYLWINRPTTTTRN
jgi:CDP-diacylglycerol--glycerol-3-phosphate 3-phosphatidyltransferase